MKNLFLMVLLLFIVCFYSCGSKEELNKKTEIVKPISPSYCRINFTVLELFPEKKAALSKVNSFIGNGAGGPVILNNDTIKIFFSYPFEDKIHEGDSFIGDVTRIEKKSYLINYYKKVENNE